MKTGLKAFSIRDAKAGVFGRPFFFISAGVAMRVFGDMCNDPNDPVGQHPEDYTLFELASWDEDTGMFTQDHQAKSLVNGIELKLADKPMIEPARPHMIPDRTEYKPEDITKAQEKANGS